MESITFAGYDTSALGLTLLSDPELAPPEPKYDLVDIPGGDGSIDLTEATGDVRYSDREMRFTFLMASDTPSEIEREKTDLMRKFHGVRSDFTLSFDPGYVYRGRAAVQSFSNAYHGSTFDLAITAEPYKYGGTQTWIVNAAGGVSVVIPCGRRRWSPIIEVSRETVVSFEGQGWTLPPGASRIADLWLRPGDNVLIINTQPGYGSTTWADYSGSTWADLHAMHTHWYEAAAGNSPRQVPLTWADIQTDSWADYPDTRWVELVHDAGSDPDYSAFVQTEIYEI